MSLFAKFYFALAPAKRSFEDKCVPKYNLGTRGETRGGERFQWLLRENFCQRGVDDAYGLFEFLGSDCERRGEGEHFAAGHFEA